MPEETRASVPIVPTHLELEELEERRDRRKFKYWALRLFSIVGAVLLLGATGAVVAIAYMRDKELNTDFITEVAKVIFDFSKYLFQG